MQPIEEMERLPDSAAKEMVVAPMINEIKRVDALDEQDNEAPEQAAVTAFNEVELVEEDEEEKVEDVVEEKP